jgi:ribosomal protein S18 acetylase RimI-like enzyme
VLILIELTDWETIEKGYAVYRDCMYLPTKEKYQQKMQAYLQDAAIKIYGCFCETALKGLLVLRSFPQKQAELVGIAVEESSRRQGIGTLMLRQVMESCCLQAVFAETDDDAVEFYRKCGFAVENHIETYDGKPVARYTCRLERYN